MNHPRFASIFAAGSLALMAACGGGGGAEDGNGPRVSDPAKVSTSTPIANAVLYTIKQDGSVSATGSNSSVTVPAGPTLTGGGGGTTQVVQPGSYTVVSNDTCAAIASGHNITVDQLLAVNRTINCNNLRIGDVLKIPPAATVAATARAGSTATGSGNKTYTVAAGDNCAAIANANGVTLTALQSANPSINANCTNIKPGDVLKIP